MHLLAGTITETCPICGYENNHDRDTCDQCGEKLGHYDELGDADLGEQHEDPTEDLLDDDLNIY